METNIQTRQFGQPEVDLDYLEGQDAARLAEAYRHGNPAEIQHARAAIGDAMDCLHDSRCRPGCVCICDLCEDTG